MHELTDKQRKVIRVLLVLSVVASMYLGLKGVFIDLYNPGSPVARQYSDIVNWMFIGTLVIALPLLFEKYQRLSKWHDAYDALPIERQRMAMWKATKPIIRQVIIVMALVVITSIVLAWYWQIPPEVMANYQSYYQGEVNMQSINISEVNNITVNMTVP